MSYYIIGAMDYLLSIKSIVVIVVILQISRGITVKWKTIQTVLLLLLLLVVAVVVVVVEGRRPCVAVAPRLESRLGAYAFVRISVDGAQR